MVNSKLLVKGCEKLLTFYLFSLENVIRTMINESLFLLHIRHFLLLMISIISLEWLSLEFYGLGLEQSSLGLEILVLFTSLPTRGRST